jgi:hypothetical protein
MLGNKPNDGWNPFLHDLIIEVLCRCLPWIIPVIMAWIMLAQKSKTHGF